MINIESKLVRVDKSKPALRRWYSQGFRAVKLELVDTSCRVCRSLRDAEFYIWNLLAKDNPIYRLTHPNCNCSLSPINESNTKHDKFNSDMGYKIKLRKSPEPKAPPVPEKPETEKPEKEEPEKEKPSVKEKPPEKEKPATKKLDEQEEPEEIEEPEEEAEEPEEIEEPEKEDEKKKIKDKVKDYLEKAKSALRAIITFS